VIEEVKRLKRGKKESKRSNKDKKTWNAVVVKQVIKNYTRINDEKIYEYDFNYTNPQSDEVKPPYTFSGYYVCTFFSNITTAISEYIIGVVCPPMPYPNPGMYDSFRSLKDYSSYYSQGLKDTVSVGSDKNITCSAEGFPPMNVAWYFVKKPDVDAHLIGAEREFLAFSNGTKSDSARKWLAEDRTLAMTNIQDNGYYLCVADNGFGPEMYLFILLRTKNPLGWLIPFFIIIGELIALCVIIFLCEMHRKKTENEATNVRTLKKRN